MSRAEKIVRRLDRPGVAADPYFGGSAPGYSQPSAIDSTGYSIHDPMADSGLPASYSVAVSPVPGGAIDDAPPGSSSSPGRLGMDGPEVGLHGAGIGAVPKDPGGSLPGDDFFGDQFANRGAPIDYVSGVGPEHSITGIMGLTGGLYDGGGYPEPATGSYRGPMAAARAFPIRQELSNVDDYGDLRTAVDDLGRGGPGGLRNVTRGEYGD